MRRYKRVMLKLSGQALGGSNGELFSTQSLRHIVAEILSLRRENIEVVAMVGGGNVFRGNVSDEWAIERVEADNIGMLGTLINGVMLRAAIKAKSDFEVRLMSAINIPAMAEPYIRLRADNHLSKGWIVILTGGIGQPYVTTDYPSVQRAIELNCDTLLAAKNGADGVFEADPRDNPNAAKFQSLSFDNALREKLNFMDQAALILARDHNLPIHVFNFDNQDAMRKICAGKDIGTLVKTDIDNKFYSLG